MSVRALTATSGPAPIIELRGVSKTYSLDFAQVAAVRDVDLAVEPRAFVALVGQSGAGKTTLMSIMGCLETPDRGEVRVGGRALHALSEDAKARLRNEMIGFVFQSFNLIPALLVWENVELPLLVDPKLSPRARRAKVQQRLEELGLGAFARFRPSELSGGQRQRVAIARALINDPPIILADEPTANLDAATAHQIVDLLVGLNRARGTTFVFSTHDDKLIRRVDRVVRMEGGRLIPEGHKSPGEGPAADAAREAAP